MSNIKHKNRKNRIMENIAMVGINAGYLISSGRFFPENPMSLNKGIIKIAEEFEDLYNDEMLEGDYIGKIDEFAQKKLLEFYGLTPEE